MYLIVTIFFYQLCSLHPLKVKVQKTTWKKTAGKHSGMKFPQNMSLSADTPEACNHQLLLSYLHTQLKTIIQFLFLQNLNLKKTQWGLDFDTAFPARSVEAARSRLGL